MNIIKKSTNSIKKSTKSIMIATAMISILSACKTNDSITPTNNTTKINIDRIAKEKTLNQDLSLKLNSEIETRSIYLWYSKDKKLKFDDVIFEVNNKIAREKYINVQLANIVNNVSIVDGLQKITNTNRKIKTSNSDLIFTDQEINILASGSSWNSILNNDKIRSYIIQENIKRIDSWLMPIINRIIIVSAEIYDGWSIWNQTFWDWIWTIVPYSSKNPIMNESQIKAPWWEIHEQFWHMISLDHQNQFAKFKDSPTWIDNLKYYEWMVNKDQPWIINWRNIIKPYTSAWSWYGSMLENWISKIIKQKNNQGDIDTLSLKKIDGSVWIIQTSDGLYDGNNNRKLREQKHNQMISKYISAYIALKKSQTWSRMSNWEEIIIPQSIIDSFKGNKSIE